MPIIRIEMLPGRTIEQKRELAESFTREMVRICNTGPEAITVVIEEVKKEHWAIGGQLLSDKYPDPRPEHP